MFVLGPPTRASHAGVSLSQIFDIEPMPLQFPENLRTVLCASLEFRVHQKQISKPHLFFYRELSGRPFQSSSHWASTAALPRCFVR